MREKIRRQLEIAHVEIEPLASIDFGSNDFSWGVCNWFVYFNCSCFDLKEEGKEVLISGALANFPFCFCF